MEEGLSNLSARFVANLKRLMAEKKISQTALANRAEVSQGMVSLILSSQRDPTLGMVAKISNALGVDPGDFLRGTTAPNLTLADKDEYASVGDSPAWVMRLDAELKIEWANQNLLDYYQLQASDLKGLTLPEMSKRIGHDDGVKEEEARMGQDRLAIQNQELVMYTQKDGTGDLLVVKVPLADKGMLAIGMPLPDHVALNEIENDLQNALKLIQASR